MWFGRLQNPAQTTQNRARSDPKPEKNDQHEPKKCKKRLRTSQERKKGAQERKMCQHGPNIKDFGLHGPAYNAVRTPPRKEKLMLMQAKNAVGFNTPGAASSAADLAPTWRPKRLQNRVQNLEKSMLKNNTFLASIFSQF